MNDESAGHMTVVDLIHALAGIAREHPHAFVLLEANITDDHGNGSYFVDVQDVRTEKETDARTIVYLYGHVSI
jgi:hypothetical protein